MSALFFTILSFAIMGNVFADSRPVTANFLQKNGKHITVQLMVHKHITGSVIFTLTLPQGVRLIQSDPPAGKYDSSGGQVKWLLRGLSPGSHDIRLHLSSSIHAVSLNAELRYLNPISGKLCVIPVKK